eukprot:gene1137-1698_t
MACARTLVALLSALVGARCVDAEVLYHGTSSAACAKIAQEGFIPSLGDGKQHSAFGEGVYFSNDQKYAARFAKRAIQAASRSLVCRVLGMFCEMQSCIIELQFPNQELGTLGKWWSSAAQYDESHRSYATPLDWVQGERPGVFVFKKQGMDRFQGRRITLRDGSGNVETATFRISPYVYFDVNGKAHVRNLNDLLSFHEKARLRGAALQYVESSVNILMSPVFHGMNAAMGMASAMSGCASADIDCVDRLAEGINEALFELEFHSRIRARNEVLATATEIVTQKRKLLLQHHPDKCQNTVEHCHEKAIKINLAAEFLLKRLEETSSVSK